MSFINFIVYYFYIIIYIVKYLYLFCVKDFKCLGVFGSLEDLGCICNFNLFWLVFNIYKNCYCMLKGGYGGDLLC